MGRRTKSKVAANNRSPAETAEIPSEPQPFRGQSPTEVRRALLLDHLHDRIDQLCVRLDALGSRIDAQQASFDTRIFMIESELRELPGMIERGMRAALADEQNGT